MLLFDPQIGPYQVQPLQARVDLGTVAMKRYSAFPKALVLLESCNKIIISHIQDTR